MQDVRKSSEKVVAQRLGKQHREEERDRVFLLYLRGSLDVRCNKAYPPLRGLQRGFEVLKD